MNLTNDSDENDNDDNSCSDDENDNNDDDDDDDDDENDDYGSDIENHYYLNNQFQKQNRLCTILRQSNHLSELKLNISYNSSLLNVIFHKNNILKSNGRQRNSNRIRRVYLNSSTMSQIETQITNWLEESTCLIDSISTTTTSYHQQCWSQLLLTYFIERGFSNLNFILCTNRTSNNDSYSCHQHQCIPEEDAYKLCSILEKGSRFNLNSNIFDHLRRIIIMKSMQEAFNDNTNLKQLYIKQLSSLKQSLSHQQSFITNSNNNRTINIASIYSKILLFLSSLYSIKVETMQILFCQHLLHNPMYSYLVHS